MRLGSTLSLVRPWKSLARSTVSKARVRSRQNERPPSRAGIGAPCVILWTGNPNVVILSRTAKQWRTTLWMASSVPRLPMYAKSGSLHKALRMSWCKALATNPIVALLDGSNRAIGRSSDGCCPLLPGLTSRARVPAPQHLGKLPWLQKSCSTGSKYSAILSAPYRHIGAGA